MNLCDSNHDEICFEGRTCPICALIDSHGDQIAKLENQIGDVEAERDDASAELEELKSQAE